VSASPGSKGPTGLTGLSGLSGLSAFIAGLPKAELHVHHVGSASPRIVSELAERHPGTVPSDPEALRSFFEFRDFAHFIEVYLAVVELIRTPEDIRYLTYEIAREMATGQGLRYAELTCTPYTSVRPRDGRGMPIEAYTEAIEDARGAAERDFGLVLRWIYDIPGEFGVPSADATLDYALNHRPGGLVGFGLGGPELGVPRPQFQPHFERARAAGLHSVPHAGETTGPQTVWDSLTLLQAERIGHGTSSAQDPALLRHLAETGVPLEVCPSSNIATRAVTTLDQHPIRAFRDAGVTVTVNSDDPPMFGTTLNREYAIAARLLDLDEAGLAELARTGLRASFAPEDVRDRVLGEIDAYVAGRPEKQPGDGQI
jgi:aminodeoxyfutalosine deaminase